MGAGRGGPTGCGGSRAQSRSAGGRGPGRREAELPRRLRGGRGQPRPSEPLTAVPGAPGRAEQSRAQPRRCSQQPAKSDGDR